MKKWEDNIQKMVKKKSGAYILQKDIDRVPLLKSRDDFQKEMKRFGQLLERRDQYLLNKENDLEESRLILMEMKQRWISETEHVEQLNEALRAREDALVGCIEKWREEFIENEKETRCVAKLKNESAEFNKWFESLAVPQSTEQILWLMGTESQNEPARRRLLNRGYDFIISKKDLFEHDADI